MVEIKILLFKPVIFHFPRHITAVIYDLKTNEKFTIDYPFPQNGNTAQIDKGSHFYDQAKNSYCVGVTKLYSNQSLQAFKKLYAEQFNDWLEFDYLSHNCSHAVNFCLDYFCFDEDYLKNRLYNRFISIMCLVTCGLSLFPAPCEYTPTEIFEKAQALQLNYGDPERLTKEHPEENIVMNKESIDEGAELQFYNHPRDLVEENICILRLC